MFCTISCSISGGISEISLLIRISCGIPSNLNPFKGFSGIGTVRISSMCFPYLSWKLYLNSVNKKEEEKKKEEGKEKDVGAKERA